MLMAHELDPALDAVVAAAECHRILLENEHVRVLEVIIEAGAKEPFHTHAWPSVFVVFGTPNLRYFVPNVESYVFEIPPQQQSGVLHLAPEGMHALENIDARRLYAFRIELKQSPAVPERPEAVGPILEAGTGGEHLCLDNKIFRLCLAGAIELAECHLPTLLLRNPNGAASAEWITTGGEFRHVRSDDIVMTPKYL